MKKTLVWTACLAMVILVAGNGMAESGNEELCIPLGTITLSAPDGVEAERVPVDFPHAVHFDYNCKECHHEWAGDTENLSCMTSGCHDATASLMMEDKDEDYRYYKTAFHGQCIVCHKEINIENAKKEKSVLGVKDALMKSGPTGCVECHPKE